MMRLKIGRALMTLMMSAIMLVSAALMTACNSEETPVVKQPAAVTIGGRPDSDTLTVGGSVQLTATVTPSGAECAFTWDSSATGVATVDASGKADAVSEGKSTISVTVVGTQITDSFELHVTKAEEPRPTAVSIKTKPASNTMAVGEVFQLSAEVTSSGGRGIDLAWDSSATSVATVDATGKATAVSEGKSTVSVTVAGTQLKDSFELTVTGEEEVTQPVQDYTRYTLEGYTSPLWKQSTVGNETVMFVGKNDEAPLLYTPTEIVSVRSMDLQTVYEEGVDYTVEGNKLKLTQNTGIPYWEENEYYPAQAVSGQTTPKKGGGNLRFGEGTTFTSMQVTVTYTHEGKWSGYVPEDQSAHFSKLLAKLEAKQPVKIVFYGDSITEGNYSRTGAPKWSQLTADYLAARYGYADSASITVVNTSKGGKGTDWAIQNLKANAIDYAPDLLVFAFGMNDYGTAPAGYGSMLDSVVTGMNAACPDTEILLVSPFLPNPESSEFDKQQKNFEPELVKVAEKYENVGYAKVTSMHNELLNMGKRYYDTTFNNVNHPNEFITRIYTTTVLRALLGDGYLTLNPQDSVATGIEITQSATSLYEGISYRFAYTLVPQNSSSGVTWSVSNDNATITADGLFTAKKAGSVTVTATVADTERSDSVEVQILARTTDQDKETFESAVLGEGQSGNWSGKKFEGAGMMSFSVNAATASIADDGTGNKALKFGDDASVSCSGVTFQLANLIQSPTSKYQIRFDLKVLSGDADRIFVERMDQNGTGGASDNGVIPKNGKMSFEMLLDATAVSALKISVWKGVNYPDDASVAYEMQMDNFEVSPVYEASLDVPKNDMIEGGDDGADYTVALNAETLQFGKIVTSGDPAECRFEIVSGDVVARVNAEGQVDLIAPGEFVLALKNGTKVLDEVKISVQDSAAIVTATAIGQMSLGQEFTLTASVAGVQESSLEWTVESSVGSIVSVTDRTLTAKAPGTAEISVVIRSDGTVVYENAFTVEVLQYVMNFDDVQYDKFSYRVSPAGVDVETYLTVDPELVPTGGQGSARYVVLGKTFAASDMDSLVFGVKDPALDKTKNYLISFDFKKVSTVSDVDKVAIQYQTGEYAFTLAEGESKHVSFSVKAEGNTKPDGEFWFKPLFRNAENVNQKGAYSIDNIVVKEVPEVSIRITNVPTAETAVSGYTLYLQSTPADCIAADSVVWSTTDAEVLAVDDKTGELTRGVKFGSVTIAANASSVYGAAVTTSFTLNFVDPEATGLTDDFENETLKDYSGAAHGDGAVLGSGLKLKDAGVNKVQIISAKDANDAVPNGESKNALVFKAMGVNGGMRALDFSADALTASSGYHVSIKIACSRLNVVGIDKSEWLGILAKDTVEFVYQATDGTTKTLKTVTFTALNAYQTLEFDIPTDWNGTFTLRVSPSDENKKVDHGVMLVMDDLAITVA